MGRVIAMVFDGTSSAQSQSQHVSEDPAIFYGRSTKTVLCEQRRHTLCQGKEAKAVPAESIRPDRSRTVAIPRVLANQYALTSQFISTTKDEKQQCFSMGKMIAVPVPRKSLKEKLPSTRAV